MSALAGLSNQARERSCSGFLRCFLPLPGLPFFMDVPPLPGRSRAPAFPQSLLAERARCNRPAPWVSGCETGACLDAPVPIEVSDNVDRTKGGDAAAVGTLAAEGGVEMHHGSLSGQFDAGLRRDAAIVLDAAVPLEVEDRLLAEARGVEIAIVHDQLIRLGPALGYNAAVRIDDAARAEQRVAVLHARLGDGDCPRRVLISARLKRQLVVEDA